MQPLLHIFGPDRLDARGFVARVKKPGGLRFVAASVKLDKLAIIDLAAGDDRLAGIKSLFELQDAVKLPRDFWTSSSRKAT